MASTSTSTSTKKHTMHPSPSSSNNGSFQGFLDRLDGWDDVLPQSQNTTTTTTSTYKPSSPISPIPIPDAASEKDLGNEYFKQKKFRQAIDCYSRSIALSPTAVAFANRAMAHLKLNRFQEAELDCSEALNLDDRYVKAYSRRATARKELAKLKEALEDAEFAVSIEPNTQELRKQYDHIKALYIKDMTTEVPSPQKSSVSAEVHKPRKGTPENAKPTTVMGTNAKVVQSPVISIQESNVANDASKERPQAVPSKRNGKKELVEDLASRAVSHFSANNSKNITPPKSAYEFEVSWKALSDDCQMQAQLLKMIAPCSLPQIFKNSLTASILVDIVKCTSTFFREETELGISILDNLVKVPRFEMICMCLSPVDRTELRRIWKEVFCAEGVAMQHMETLSGLGSKYLRE